MTVWGVLKTWWTLLPGSSLAGSGVGQHHPWLEPDLWGFYMQEQLLQTRPLEGRGHLQAHPGPGPRLSTGPGSAEVPRLGPLPWGGDPWCDSVQGREVEATVSPTPHQ